MRKLFAILLSALLLSVLPTAAGASSDAELIAYWNFDELNEDGTVSDLTGNGIDLTMRDSAYVIVDGYSGSTFDFNGGSSAYDNSKHLAIDSDLFVPHLNGSSAVTMTAFMKKEVKGSGTNFTMFALNAGSNSIMAYAQAAKIGTSIRSDYNSPATATAADLIYPNIDDFTSPDAWMHVALVIDYANNDVKIYADGVLVGHEQAEAAPQSFRTNVASYKTDVGDINVGWFGVGGRHVLVDEFKIYRGALSEEEIKRSVPPTMAYDFEELNGNLISDLGVNGMDMQVDSAEVVPGVTGNTLKFNSAVTLPLCAHRGILYGAKEQSISCWLKLSDGRLPVSSQALFREGEKDAFRLELTPEGAISVGTKSANADRYQSLQTPDGVFAQEDTAWHHVYADFDYVAKKGRIFINGALVTEGNLNFSSAYYNMGVTGNASALGSNFDMLDLSSDASVLMDSLKFYRRKLTDSEISEQVQELLMVTPAFSQNGTSVSAVCNVVNLTDADIPEQKMTLILGAYDKATNRMVNATFLNLPSLARYRGMEGQTLTLEGLSNPGDLRYKLFVWYGMDSFASYQDEVVYTFDE